MTKRIVITTGVAGVLLLGLSPRDLAAGDRLDLSIALDNGDTNGDQARDLSDGVYLLTHLFLGGPAPVPLAYCDGEIPAIENGDSNGDGTLDLSDPIHFMDWLFFSGQKPASPCSQGVGAGRDEDDDDRVRILSPRRHREAYSRLAGEFWQWLLSFPGDETNPFLSGDCVAEKQPEDVFFITGAIAADPPVTRHCTIDEDTFVFFPIINTECSNLEPDPFGCVDEASCLACNDKFYSADNDVLSLTINGREIRKLTRFRVQSGIFELEDLPANNFLGAPEGSDGISLADGYYVLLAPLPEGEHTIEFRGCLDGFGGCEGFEVLVVYNIAVVDDDGDDDDEEEDGD